MCQSRKISLNTRNKTIYKLGIENNLQRIPW